MIRKVKITKLWIDKIPAQYGSFKTNFMCEEQPDVWISGFAKKCDWKIGDEVELDIVASETINNKTGKPFLNWKFPPENKALLELAQIKFTLAKHDKYLKDISDFLKAKFPKTTLPEPNFDGVSPQEAQKAKEQREIYNQENYPEYNTDEVNGDLSIISDEQFENA